MSRVTKPGLAHITNILYRGKHNGLYVRVNSVEGVYKRYFSIQRLGGKEKALAAATAWRDEVVRVLAKRR